MVRIDEVFDIKYGEFSTPIQKLVIGETPLITSGGQNNGVAGNYEIRPIYKNVISVARTGSVGETFYHSYNCVITSDCMVLTPKVELTIQEIYWYVLLIRKSKNLFSYSRKITPKRLGQILIPNHIPEWVFNFKWDTDFEVNTSLNRTIVSLQSREWHFFVYNQIFDLKKGERIVNAAIKSGNTPCIRPIEGNNGVYDYISLEPNHEGNTITVNYNGSVAEAFYQSKPYFALDDINILYPKFNLNPYIAMFLISLIRKEKYRFNYGRKWNIGRMKQSQIKLPVTETGEPDWEFMENYIKSLPYSKSL
jgi:Type I restriction modification DNA specificity domain